MPPKIIDITYDDAYEKFLYRCFVGPFRRYKRRMEYLDEAIPKGFHKKLLMFKGEAVGQIEYVPAEVSYYPIMGNKVIVMNCVWVLRKAEGHNFGRMLVEDMMKSEEDAIGFATIALEDHWSPWFRKWQMERLGFKSVDSVDVSHALKYKGQRFTIHLMWIPKIKNAQKPDWNKKGLLEGIYFCIAHPLYHPQSRQQKHILIRE